MDQEQFEMERKCIRDKFTMYNWVFGIVITLQLLTFSWLGYLSKTIVSLQIDYTSTKNVIIEKMDTFNKNQDKMDEKLDCIHDKLTNKIGSNNG